ncbi:MAG: hypothetical protein M3P18_08375 [Actinomycetota bacterium]|nr:hypothetical protein [Actinomycetota bacterium]
MSVSTGAGKWLIGDPVYEPLFRDLITIMNEFIDWDCRVGIAKLEAVANEAQP